MASKTKWTAGMTRAHHLLQERLHVAEAGAVSGVVEAYERFVLRANAGTVAPGVAAHLAKQPVNREEFYGYVAGVLGMSTGDVELLVRSGYEPRRLSGLLKNAHPRHPAVARLEAYFR